MRLGISNPSANTDVAIYTATGPFLASIIATNKSASATSNVRMWIVPSGATLTSQYAYLAYDQDIVPQNTLETHRFALNQNDVVYVRADTADMSFMINGLKQVDIALAAGVTSYSNTPPLDVMDGMIWVDKDGNGTAVPDTFLKQTSSTSFGEASTVNINTKPWNMPWGVVSYVKTNTSNITYTSETLSITAPSFTAFANRMYKATYVEGTTYGSAAGEATARIRLTNTSGAIIGISRHILSNTASTNAILTGVFTLTAGTQTVVGSLQANTGTGTAYRADGGASIIIEDIGPA